MSGVGLSGAQILTGDRVIYQGTVYIVMDGQAEPYREDDIAQIALDPLASVPWLTVRRGDLDWASPAPSNRHMRS